MTPPLAPADKFLPLVLRALARAVDEKKLPIGLAALEALFAIRNRIEKEELSVVDWNERVGRLEGHVVIPYWAFEALTNSYSRYTTGEKELSLNEGLGVGKGQGKRKTTWEGVKKFRRNLGFAVQVENLRKTNAKTPISLENAYLEVAHQNNVGQQTVKRAYREFAPLLNEVLGQK